MLSGDKTPVHAVSFFLWRIQLEDYFVKSKAQQAKALLHIHLIHRNSAW